MRDILEEVMSSRSCALSVAVHTTSVGVLTGSGPWGWLQATHSQVSLCAFILSPFDHVPSSDLALNDKF